MNQPVKHPTKKRHHQIPRFYLRGFIAPGPAGAETIWTYDKTNGGARPSLVDNTAYEKHLYSGTDDSGERLTDVEDLISSIESKAAPLLVELLSRGTLSGQDRGDFVSFLAMMYVRTDAFRRMFAEAVMGFQQMKNYHIAQHDDIFEKHIERYEKHRGFPVGGEERKDIREWMLDPSGFDVSLAKGWTLRALGKHDQIAPILFEMKWAIIDASPRSYFVTSDNPMTVAAPDGDQRGPFRGVGFLTRNVEVTMPLTKFVCWVGHWANDDWPDRFPATKRMVKHLNVTRAIRAERFLFGPTFDAGVKRLTKKYANSKMGVEISGFGPADRPQVRLRRGR